MNDGGWDGWIGVDDIDEENVWRNVKGKNVDYLPWSAGQPGTFKNSNSFALRFNF